MSYQFLFVTSIYEAILEGGKINTSKGAILHLNK